MDTSSISKPANEQPEIELLPAGSTIEVAPGVHVPHPHAEPNLPGAGDPRFGNTKAISEVFDGAGTKRVPLLDEIRPRATTVNPAAKTLPEKLPAGAAPVPTNATQTKLAEEPPSPTTEAAKIAEAAK